MVPHRRQPRHQGRAQGALPSPSPSPSVRALPHSLSWALEKLGHAVGLWGFSHCDRTYGPRGAWYRAVCLTVRVYDVCV
jgi:hypothetical protein